MKKPYKNAERTQTIITESGIELIINHDRKDKCEKCKRERIWGLVPLELVGLAYGIYKLYIHFKDTLFMRQGGFGKPPSPSESYLAKQEEIYKKVEG